MERQVAQAGRGGICWRLIKLLLMFAQVAVSMPSALMCSAAFA